MNIDVMSISSQEAKATRDHAELLYSAAEVETALDRMAIAISNRFSGADPIVICVMNGGVIPTASLLLRLDFPLRQDYIHATRYRGATVGSELHWVQRHSQSLAGQNVLLVDDILDEGVTLSAIVDVCRKEEAASVLTAVLVEKKRPRKSSIQADFVGLEVEDRYVFGYGMDYGGYLRNAPGIFGLASRIA